AKALGGASGSRSRAGSELPAQLSAALSEAMRARDATAVSALRSALAAISNAEAVPARDGAIPGPGSPHVAGAVAGLGAAEAPRIGLGEAEISGIIRAEITERLDAAAGFERSGRAARAARLRGEAEILAAIIGMAE